MNPRIDVMRHVVPVIERIKIVHGIDALKGNGAGIPIATNFVGCVRANIGVDQNVLTEIAKHEHKGGHEKGKDLYPQSKDGILLEANHTEDRPGERATARQRKLSVALLLPSVITQIQKEGKLLGPVLKKLRKLVALKGFRRRPVFVCHIVAHVVHHEVVEVVIPAGQAKGHAKDTGQKVAHAGMRENIAVLGVMDHEKESLGPHKVRQRHGESAQFVRGVVPVEHVQGHCCTANVENGAEHDDIAGIVHHVVAQDFFHGSGEAKKSFTAVGG